MYNITSLITLLASCYWRYLRYNAVAHALGEQAEAAVTYRCYLYLPLHTPCTQVLTLSENKQKMLAFVESRMSVVCPNRSVSPLPTVTYRYSYAPTSR